MERRVEVDELHRVGVARELDQAVDHVQAVRELVLLGAERVGEVAHVVELAEQRLEVGAVAQRDDRADRAAAHLDGHPVHDQHPLADEDDLVAALDAAREDVAQPTGRDNLLERRPSADPSIPISRCASSLIRVRRPAESIVRVPSRTPCSIASRCSSSAAISRGSSPKVCRLTRRASRNAPSAPSARPSSGGMDDSGSRAASSELT